METLLDKVQSIEREVAERVRQVESEHASKLEDLREAEPKVIDDVREQAEARAASIIKENIAAAEDEINSLKQDQARSVDSVRSSTPEHRQGAVTLAVDLFKQTFLAT